MDLSIRMKNKLHFSRCADPSKPVFPAGSKTLLVVLTGDILIISDTNLFAGNAENARRFMPHVQRLLEPLREFAANRHIYAKRTAQQSGVQIFEILEQLPAGRTDALFGAVLPKSECDQLCKLWKDDKGWHLYAYGADNSEGRQRFNRVGWIFEADEIVRNDEPGHEANGPGRASQAGASS
jgi:hypothetical protein